MSDPVSDAPEIDGEPVPQGAERAGSAEHAETFEAIIPAEPGVYRPLATYAEQTRKKKIDSIIGAMQSDVSPVSLEDACWLVAVDPEDLDAEMKRDPSIYVRIMQARARANKALIRDIRAGGKNLDRAKAALAIMQATTWKKETNALEVRFRHALTELKKRLQGPMTGEEAMKIVVDVFSRHV